MKHRSVCSVCDAGPSAAPVFVALFSSLAAAIQLPERKSMLVVIFRGDLVFLLMHMVDEIEWMSSCTRGFEVVLDGERV